MLKLEVKNNLIVNHQDLKYSCFDIKLIQKFIESNKKEGTYCLRDVNIQKVDIKQNHYLLILTEENKKQKDLLLAGEMTAGLIHDINNQLGALISGSEVLKAFNSDNPFVMKQVENILNGTNNIAAMINGASSLFKSEKTKLENICIKDLFEIVTKTSKSLLYQTGIELTYNLPKSIDKFKGIDNQLIRVLTNMIKNSKDAIKDLPDSRKWIELKAHEDNDFVYIQVKDGGNGISSEVKSKMFNPFFTTKTEGEGSGIGLDVCKKIAKEHGGDIWVENSSKNTEFVFSISKTISNQEAVG